MTNTLHAILLYESETKMQGQEFSLTMTFAVCKAANKRFETDECGQYLNECNLCGETQHCIDHGCSNCGLERDANTAAMTLIPAEERELMLGIQDRRANLIPQKRLTALKKATRPAQYYRELYLQDILDTNKLNNYAV